MKNKYMIEVIAVARYIVPVLADTKEAAMAFMAEDDDATDPDYLEDEVIESIKCIGEQTPDEEEEEPQVYARLVGVSCG